MFRVNLLSDAAYWAMSPAISIRDWLLGWEIAVSDSGIQNFVHVVMASALSNVLILTPLIYYFPALGRVVGREKAPR